MSFGLTNAPEMFMSFINGVVKRSLDSLVKNLVLTSSVMEVRCLVGLASCLFRFSMNFASTSTHMTILTKKEISFDCMKNVKRSF